MNLVVMSGRLTKDPDNKYTANNNAVTTFNLAVDRRDEQKNTDFFPCVAWKKTAELIAKYCSKGDKITLRGRLQNRSWEDNDGDKHTVTEIIVDEVEFQPKNTEKAEKPVEKPKPAPKKQEEEFYDLDALDVPF